MLNRLAKCVFLLKLLLLLLLFAACQHNNTSIPLLSQADSLMNSSPDSALHLLESIQKPQEMSEACRAQYALLMTQAWDKNWIPMTNDSLIQIAVDYYKERHDKAQATKAYYYLGCVYEDLDNQIEATNAFLQALMASPKNVQDAKQQSMIYEGIGRCYASQGFYEKALEAYRTAYNISLDNNLKEGMLPSLDGIVRVFVYEDIWDSAAYYSNKIIETSRVVGDSSWVSVGFRNLAEIFYNEERWSEAYQAAIKSIHKQQPEKNGHRYDVVNNHMLISDIFIGLELYDSARYYLSLCDTVSDIYTRALGTLSLYELEKSCGKYKDAIQYNDSFRVLYDSIKTKERKTEMAKLINNYTIEKYKRKITEKQELQTRILIYCFVFIVVVGAFVMLMIDRSRKREYMNLQRSLMKKRGEMIKLQEELNELNTIEEPSQELVYEQEYKRQTLKNLQKEKFQYNILLFQKTPYYKTLCELNVRKKLDEKVFTAAERDVLCDCIYQTFADTMSDLKMQCPELTKDDAFYCIFYLLKYSNQVIIACTGTSANALKTRKSRLKHKMSEELCAYVFKESKVLIIN